MELYVGLMVLTLAAEVYLPFRDIGSAFHASEDGMDALKRARAQINHPQPKPMAVLLDTGTTHDDVVELNDVTISYKALHEIAEPAYAGPEYLTPQQFAEAQRNKDRKSTRLNFSHVAISYAVFCLKKKKKNHNNMNNRTQNGTRHD